MYINQYLLILWFLNKPNDFILLTCSDSQDSMKNVEEFFQFATPFHLTLLKA